MLSLRVTDRIKQLGIEFSNRDCETRFFKLTNIITFLQIIRTHSRSIDGIKFYSAIFEHTFLG